MLRFLFLVATCWLWCVSTPLHAEELPDGTWKWTNEMSDRTIESTLVLRSKGEKLTGSYNNQNFEAKVEQGQIKGDKLQFEINMDGEGRKLNIQFSGALSASGIAGSLKIFVDGELRIDDVEWNPKRHVGSEEVVGVWDFAFTSPDGVERSPQLVVTEKGSGLVGTLTDGDRVTEIKSIEVSDDGFQFAFNMDFQGSDLKLTYDCEPRGDQLTGSIFYDLSGETGEFDIAAKRRQANKSLSPWLGEWEFTMTDPDGIERKTLLKLTTAGGELAAELSNEETEFELASLELADEELSFEFRTQHDGSDIGLKWRCSLNGKDAMQGTLTYDTGGETGDILMSGKRK